MSEDERAPTWIRPCPQCRLRLTLFDYQDQLGADRRGGQCPAGHQWSEATLVALAYQIKGQVGTV